MPTFRNLSMQWKLLWVSMLANGTTLLLVCAAFVFYDLVTFREVMVRQFAGQAEIIGSNSASALLFDDVDVLQQRCAPRWYARHRRWDLPLDGRQFATMCASRPRGAVLPHSSAVRQTGTALQTTSGPLFRPIVGGQQVVGTVYITADLDEIQQRLTRYLGIASLVGLVSFVFALLISSWLQRRISCPLLDLAHWRHGSSQRRRIIRCR